MDLCNLSVIKQVMADAGITFRKEFGQNFLTNRLIPEDISENCTDNEKSLIIEIGPGIGCLTVELARRYERVVAIEIDKGLIPVLDKTLADYPNVTHKYVLKGNNVLNFIGDHHDLRVSAFGTGGEAQLKAIVLANGCRDGLPHKATRHTGAGGIRKSPHADGLFSLQHHVGGEDARHLKIGADPRGSCLGGGGLFVCGEGGGVVKNFVMINGKSPFGMVCDWNSAVFGAVREG